MNYPYVYSGDTISVLVEGVPHQITKDDPNWDRVLEIIKNGENVSEPDMKALLDRRAQIEANLTKYKVGNVTVGNDGILYKGNYVHTHLTARMMEMLNEGIDIKPWADFMDKLYQNPSKTAVDELYLWLEKAKMPLTPDGDFLAYKKVQNNYTSYHSHPDGSRCFNRIGDVVEMARNEVDDNRNRTCSAGLHFCSFHYLPSYFGGQGRVVVVKINPADVVSIPSDYDNAKGRAWRYKVVNEVPEKEAQFAFEDVHVDPCIGFLDYDEGEFDEDVCNICGDDIQLDGSCSVDCPANR